MKPKQRKSCKHSLCDLGPLRLFPISCHSIFCITLNHDNVQEKVHLMCRMKLSVFHVSMHYLLFFIVGHHTCGFAGSLVLVGGDPGVGKSTLMLQVKIHIWLLIVKLVSLFLCFQPINSLHAVIYLYL